MTNVMILTLQSSTFPLILCSNIPLSPAYGVYISQLIRYARAFFAYEDFPKRDKLLTKKLVLQGYNESRLKLSFRKFCDRYNDLVYNYMYKLSLAHMLNDLLHTIWQTVIFILALTTGNPVYLFRLWAYEGATCQQMMLIPPRHLILPSHLLGVRVALHSFCKCLLDYDYVLHIVNFVILYLINRGLVKTPQGPMVTPKVGYGAQEEEASLTDWLLSW
jgi:hypothetical protein